MGYWVSVLPFWCFGLWFGLGLVCVCEGGGAKREGVGTHVGNGRHALEMYALNEAEGGGNGLGFRVV